MNNKNMLKRSLLGAALLGGIFFTLSAHAQIEDEIVLYTTEFTGTNGSIPADWGRSYSTSNHMDIQNNRFEWRRVSSAQAYLGWYGGSYESIPSKNWADYRVDSVIQTNNPGNIAGIVLRWQGEENPGQGYFGFFHRSDDKLRLAITKDFNPTGNGGGTILTETLFDFTLENEGTYRLSFETVGNDLTLTFANLANTETFSITATDNSYSKGAPAMRAYLSTNGRWVAWDSMTVTGAVPIPESSTVASISALVVLLAAGLYRRRLCK